MADFLRQKEVLEADIIALQEPWRNPFKDDTHHPAKATHYMLYPPPETSAEEEQARVCIFIRKALSPGAWSHTAHSRDCQELQLRYRAPGEVERGLRIFNIYNRPELHQLSAAARLINLLTGENDELVLGDFNLHHPMWGGSEAVTDDAADNLLDEMEERRFGLWLPPGTPTRKANGHEIIIDLVWGSHNLSRRLVACYVDETIHADSDHLPIRTLIDIETPLTDPPKWRNWKAMDRPKFTKFVEENLATLQFWKNHAGEEVSSAQIDAAVDQLVEIVQRGITESTPWAKPSAWANPSFTPECCEAIWDARRAF
jgi:endonuclease/exonuclease/phosphatase family metal-dependent hydrolase